MIRIDHTRMTRVSLNELKPRSLYVRHDEEGPVLTILDNKQKHANETSHCLRGRNLQPAPIGRIVDWFSFDSSEEMACAACELDEDTFADVSEMRSDQAVEWLRNRGVEVV